MRHAGELVIILVELVYIPLFKPGSKVGRTCQGWCSQGPHAWRVPGLKLKASLAGPQQRCIPSLPATGRCGERPPPYLCPEPSHTPHRGPWHRVL